VGGVGADGLAVLGPTAGRRRALWIGRLVGLLAAVLVGTLVVGLMPGVPPRVALAESVVSAAQPDRSVPVEDWRVEPVAETPMAEHEPQAVVWPQPASRVVDLPADGHGGRLPVSVSVGGLPVRLAPAAGLGNADVMDPATGLAGAPRAADAEAPSRLRVTLLDAAAAAGVGGPGVLALRVTRADGSTTSSTVQLEVDYSAFRDAFGAEWSNRLRLATIRECQDSPPDAGEQEDADCGRVVFLPTRTDFVAGKLSAEVDLAGFQPAETGSGQVDDLLALMGEQVSTGGGEVGTMVMVMSGPSGDGGDFTKTDLKASYTWQHGGSSGHFNWSYPIEVPPVPGGLVPQVSLDYNSGAVDGQTAGQNVQPSWLGEGWSYEPSYIERTYRPCFDDTANSPHWTSLNDKSVLCWRWPNAQIVLNGKSTEIIRGDDGMWRLAEDDGERVQLLTGADNRDNNGEHWRITTTDGTQYWFGRHWLPNGRGSTNSTAEVRVYGNHSGEPCFSTESVNASRCNQAYRWMLDYVVDRHGNEISYWYSSETNRARTHGSSSYQYRRAIRPVRIEYGTRVGDDPATPAPARIVFTAGDRCLADCYTSGGDPKPANWPDTPWDLQCDATPCDNNVAPSFFTSKRLAQISTQVRDGGSWRTVDQYDLAHTFPSTGTALSPALWLSAITRTAYAPDGTPQVFPSVTFTGERRSQRADYDPNATMADNRKWRVVRVNTETGGRIEVVYNEPQSTCEFGSTYPAPHNNTRRCFPRLYTNSFNQTGWSWWHLFTVAQIIEKDLVGGSPDVVHAYSYANTGSSTSVKWAHDNGAAVWGSSLPYRSWSDWRGWARVTVRTGTASEGPRSRVDTLYFRGLHGDRANSAGDTRTVELTDIHGSVFTDHLNRAGRVLQQVTYDVSGGSPVHAVRHQQVRYHTGTRNLSTNWAIPNVHRSYISRDSYHEEWDFNPDTQAWTRFERIRYRWDDSNGRLNSISDVHRDTCVRFEYADNTSKRLLDRVSRETTNRLTCDKDPGQLLADTRHFYDGLSTHGATPTTGNLTKTEIHGESGWFTETQTGYDSYGRVTSSSDGLGRTRTTQYAHNSDRRLATITTTNAAGHVTTTALEPGRGLPLTLTDPNFKTTTGEYDPSGRLVKVWAPGHDTSGTATVEHEYAITKTAPTWVSTKVMGPAGNQIPSYEIYDGFLRLRQEQRTAPDGNRVIVDTAYNHRGQEAKVSTFYNGVSGPSSTLVSFADGAVDRQVRYLYDGQGRQTKAQRWSQNAVLYEETSTYGYRDVVTVPPAGGTVTRQLFDGPGNVIAERKYRTTNPAGAYDEITFTYDRLDRLDEVIDADGNVWTHEYDLAGRLVGTTDPDSGATTIIFDNAGQITEVIDARGVTLAYEYDLLGRQTALHQNSLAGPKLAEWVYDTVELGQLTSTTRHDDGLAYISEVTSYDDGYQPLATKITIPASAANGQLAGEYTEEMTYHPDGSLATHAMPAAGGHPAETLTYTYTATGLLDSMIGVDDYLVESTYRWDGSLAETMHGAPDKRVRQSWSYNEATGWLLAAQVDTEDQSNSGVFLERFTTSYSYDDVGNVLAVAGRTDGALDQVECFNYDYLRRLARAWTQDSEGCATPQATGVDAYHRSWTHDEVGNRLNQTDYDAVAGNTTWTYLVGATNGVTAHQVAEVNATGPKAGTSQRLFAYDDAGNMTTRTTESGASQTLAWDAEGRLASATEGADVTEYLYDADGNRLLAREPGGTTLYLGSIEIVEQSGGAVIGTRYYGDTAVRTVTGLRWVASERNGTAVAQIHADTLQSERRRMLPYGEPRGSQPSWAGTRGYVGGSADDTGLTHLGARSYDPSLGRFISVDPIMNLDDAIQWHGYSYANNSPVVWADPDGLMPMCIDWCGSPADKSVRAAQQKQQTSSSGGAHSRAVPPQKKPASTSSSSKSNGSSSSAGSSTRNDSPKPSSKNKKSSSKPKPKSNAKPAPMCSQGMADVCIDDSKPQSSGGGFLDQRAGIAADIAKWAGKIADVLGFIPGFLCGVCAGAALIFGLLAALGYLLAGMIEKAIGAALSAGVGLIAGKAGKVALKQVVKSYGGKMVHFARHWDQTATGQRVLRAVPTSLRIKVEWLTTTISGTVSAAFSAIATADF
jgi:RHS repeat-associated protein